MRMARWHKDEKGYPRFSDSDKLVHRWKAEKKLGRKLSDGEVVHHKNRRKADYSDSNLWVFPSQRQHWMLHRRATDRRATLSWRAHRKDGW